MNKLLQSMKRAGDARRFNQRTRTTKGAGAHASIRTGDSNAEAVLPFFTNAGAMRGRTDEVWQLFQEALTGHELMAIRALFYLRNPRHNGAGERQLFRDTFIQFAERNDRVAAKVAGLIPEFGRWDDLLTLAYHQGAMYRYPLTWKAITGKVRIQLQLDSFAVDEGVPTSLLPKWMPSINSKSAKTRGRAHFWRKQLGLNNEQYRKLLSKTRAPINLVENLMSRNLWHLINYATVPAKAHLRLRDKFMEHDAARYSAYLATQAQESGGIKVAGLAAHEIIRQYSGSRQLDKTLEAQWNALIEEFGTNSLKVLPVFDNSASMGRWTGRVRASGRPGAPREVAIALAAFFSQVNDSAFRDWVMSFENDAKMHHLNGKCLLDRMWELRRQTSDHGTTNVASVYRTLLKFARNNSVPAEDMPEVLLLVSDMQFDMVGYGYRTALEDMRIQYANAGYEMPVVVFWNVNAHTSSSPVKADDRGTIMVSGLSQQIMKTMLQMDIEQLRSFTPLGAMWNTLNSDPYNKIVY